MLSMWSMLHRAWPFPPKFLSISPKNKDSNLYPHHTTTTLKKFNPDTMLLTNIQTIVP